MYPYTPHLIHRNSFQVKLIRPRVYVSLCPFTTAKSKAHREFLNRHTLNTMFTTRCRAIGPGRLAHMKTMRLRPVDSFIKIDTRRCSWRHISATPRWQVGRAACGCEGLSERKSPQEPEPLRNARTATQLSWTSQVPIRLPKLPSNYLQ